MEEPDGDLISVADTKDVPPGTLKRVLAAGTQLVIANVDGEYFAVAAKCTHRAAPLVRGRLDGGRLICPWHNGSFDLATGEPLTPPVKKPIKTFPVSVDEGRIHVRIASE